METEIRSKISNLNKDDIIYSPICGNIKIYNVKVHPNGLIMAKNKNGAAFIFDKYGYYVGTSIRESRNFKSNEIMLFPSEQMRDWNKLFCKGDILRDNSRTKKGVFYGYTDNTKRYPIVCYVYTVFAIKAFWSYEESSIRTENWDKVTEHPIETEFINLINEHYKIIFDRYDFVRPKTDTKVRSSKLDEIMQYLNEDPVLCRQMLNILTGKETYVYQITKTK